MSSEYSLSELMVAAAAREIRDHEVVFVGMRLPLIIMSLMALFLLHGCEQAREKLTRHRDETPLAAPVATASPAEIHAQGAPGSVSRRFESHGSLLATAA